MICTFCDIFVKNLKFPKAPKCLQSAGHLLCGHMCHFISWTFIQSRLEVHICCYRAETEGDEMPLTDTEVCVKPSKMHFWFIDAEKSILFKFSFNLNQVCSWLGQTTCLIIVTFHPSYLHITHVHDCYRMDWLGYIYGYLQSEARSEDTRRQPTKSRPRNLPPSWCQLSKMSL